MRAAGGRRIRSAAAAIVAVAACAAAAPAQAQVGTYSVWSCRGPDGTPVGTGAWAAASVAARPGDVIFADGCARGGALALELASGRRFDSPVAATATFRAPADTRIVGYELWRSLAAAEPRLLGLYNFAARVSESVGGVDSTAYGCATFGEQCTATGDFGRPLAPANHVRNHRAPLAAVALEVRCEWPTCARPHGAPARAHLHRSRIELEDLHAPALPQVSLAGRTLIVAASDRGSGISALSLAIDGGGARTLASSDSTATCRTPYTVPRPCPVSVERAFALEGSALRDGSHVASGTVVDAAGNVRPWTVRFTTGDARGGTRLLPGVVAPPPANGTPAVERPRLRLARKRVSHRRGRAARVRGRLQTAAGEPVTGARLTVSAVDLAVAGSRGRPRRLPTVTTNAAGRFSVRVRRAGAQRITVAFAPQPGATTVQRSAIVRTPLALRASRDRRLLVKGNSVTLHGRLSGAGRSAKGALVEIQSIVNRRWRPVGTARVRANGRYAWRYRFVHLTHDTVFSFRAVVNRVPGWPWPSERSPRVTVRVNVP